MPRLSPEILDDLGVYAGGLSIAEMDSRYPGFQTFLPDWGNDYGAHPPPTLNRRTEAEAMMANGVLQIETTRAALGVVATNIGVPLPGAFGTLKAALDNPIGALIWDQMGEIMKEAAEEALKMAIEATQAAMQGLEIGMNMITSIPIYGYIIELVYKFVQAIVGLVGLIRAQREAKEQYTEYEWPRYDSAYDLKTYNTMLYHLRETVDWTWVWMPPYVEIDPVMNAYFGRTDLVGDGYLLSGLIPTGSPGCVPGLAWVHEGILLTTGQYPRAYEVAETTAPSSRQQHAALWKALSQNNMNPGIYCVDGSHLEKAWGQYIEQMWVSIRAMDLPNSQRNQIQNLLGGPNGPFGTAGGATGIDLSRAPTTADIENMLPYREASILRQRQWALTDSTLIAYLNSDMAALQTDASLKQRWQERKQELLQHPARCSIIMDDVEDTIYYQYLHESGVGTMSCQTVTDFALAPGFKGGDEAPTGTQEMGPLIMASPRRPRGGGGAALAMAAAAAFLILRKR